MLIAGLGVVAWLALGGGDDMATIEQDSQTSQQLSELSNDQPQLAPIQQQEFDQLVYGFALDLSSPITIYNRPTAGGDRTAIDNTSSFNDLDFASFGTNLDLVASVKYAYIKNNKEIWVGSPEGQPENIYSHSPGSQTEEIRDAVISPDGELVAYLSYSTSSPTNEHQLFVISSEGGQPELILDAVDTAPFAWSSDGKMLYLGLPVIASDAPLSPPSIVNVAAKTKSQIEIKAEAYQLGAYAISPDGQKIAYVKSTVDKDQTTDDLVGYYVGKPFKIYWKNVNGDGSENLVATINGNNQPRSIVWNDDSMNFYADKGSEIVQYSNSGSDPFVTYDTTTSDRFDVLYGYADDVILAGAALDDGGYDIFSVDLKKKNRDLIMSTNDATIPIGILFK